MDQTHKRLIELEGACEAKDRRIEELEARLATPEGSATLSRIYESWRIHLAGMSEMAERILHLVGNQINKIQIRVGEATRLTNHQGFRMVKQGLELIMSQQGSLDAFLQDDPRGKQLFPNLFRVLEQIQRVQDNLQEHLKLIADVSMELEETLHEKTRYLALGSTVEQVNLLQILAQAKTFVEETSTGFGSVSYKRKLHPDATVIAHPYRLLQVFSSLLHVAIDRILQDETPMGTIWVKSRLQDNAPLWEVAIEHNGRGYTAEEIKTLFRPERTTKHANLRGGIGIHECANYLRSIHGNMVVHSPGPEQGARFLLTLPAHMTEHADVRESSDSSQDLLETGRFSKARIKQIMGSE